MEIYFRKFELIDDCLKRLEKIKKSNPNVDKYRRSFFLPNICL
jgi:hypothetical protein